MRAAALRAHFPIVLFASLALLLACGGGPTAVCTGCPPPLVKPFLVGVAEPTLQSSQLLSFPVDPATGALGASSSIAGPEPPIAGIVAAGEALQFFYVTPVHPTQGISPEVYGYTIDPQSGALSEIASSPYDAPDAITLSGGTGLNDFVYFGADALLNQGLAPTVEAFSVGGDGSLSPSISGSPFAVGPLTNELGGPGPWLAGLSPYLYATEYENSAGGIAGFSFDINDGVLTPLPGSPFSLPISATPAKLVFDPLGYVFVGLSTPPPNMQNYVAGYAIDSGTGVLTPVSGSPFSVESIAGLAIDASGKYLFTGTDQSLNIEEFQVDPVSGTLTALAGTKAAVFGPFLVSGNYLYAPTSSLIGSSGGPGAIAAFSIDENTGALTSLSGSPFPAGAPILAMTTVIAIGRP